MNLQDMVPEAVQFGGATGLSLGLVLVTVRWVATFLASRHDTREAQLDAGNDKLFKAMAERLDRVTERLDKVETELAQAREDLLECERRHAVKDGEIAELRAILRAQGSMRNEAQVLIAADKIARKGREET